MVHVYMKCIQLSEPHVLMYIHSDMSYHYSPAHAISNLQHVQAPIPRAVLDFARAGGIIEIYFLLKPCFGNNTCAIMTTNMRIGSGDAVLYYWKLTDRPLLFSCLPVSLGSFWVALT